MEWWQERKQNVSQILRSLALISDHYWFASGHSHATMFQTSSVKLGTATIFWAACAQRARMYNKAPKKLHCPLHAIPTTVGRLWSCLDVNIWFMPCILYSLKPVALFHSPLKMMNITLHIPLLISHVFMYQASGYIIIYITGDWTKKTLNNLQGNQNTFGPNQSEMLIFPIWTTATAKYLLFMIMQASKFLLQNVWAWLHL